MTKSDDNLLPDIVAGALDLLPGGALLGVLGERATRAVIAETRRNRSLVLRLARDRANLSREDLDELVLEHPEVVPLLIRTFHAAGMTGQDKTLRMLGGFLGDALSDVTKVSDVETLIGAVQDLTEHHIKVLEIVASSTQEHPEIADKAGSHWTTGLVIAMSAMRPELVLAGVQGLLAAGFISDAGLDGGGATWNDIQSGGTILVVTELGRTVLDVLQQVIEASGS